MRNTLGGCTATAHLTSSCWSMLVHFLRRGEGFRSAVAGHSSSQVHLEQLVTMDVEGDSLCGLTGDRRVSFFEDVPCISGDIKQRD